MNVRKRKIQYYFSVEGETEKWYLEWLQRQINSTDNAAYGVVFNVKVEKINIMNTHPKDRRVGRYTGKTNRYKKAIVKLAEGSTISFD